MGFEQAAIKVQKEAEFEELKGAIRRAFGPGNVEAFLKRLKSENLRVRDCASVLASGVFERVDEVLEKSGKTAESLYQSLALSDQAQIREFYLFRVEEVDPKLRTKFQRLYRYY